MSNDLSTDVVRKVRFVIRQRITESLGSVTTPGADHLRETWLAFTDDLELPETRTERDTLDLTHAELSEKYERDIQAALDASGGKQASAESLIRFFAGLDDEARMFFEVIAEQYPDMAAAAKQVLDSFVGEGPGHFVMPDIDDVVQLGPDARPEPGCH